jgi:hypothetical protein
VRMTGRDVADLDGRRRKGRGRGWEWRGVLGKRCRWLGSGRDDGERRWGGSSGRFSPCDGRRGWRRGSVDELGVFKSKHGSDACPEVWPGLRSFDKADI